MSELRNMAFSIGRAHAATVRAGQAIITAESELEVMKEIEAARQGDFRRAVIIECVNHLRERGYNDSAVELGSLL